MLNSLAQRLTSRELEVLVLVASGASAKEIARQLRITARTVETHINHLKLKTRSRNRAHLVAMALEAGLIDNPCHRLGPVSDKADASREMAASSNDHKSPNKQDEQDDLFRSEAM